MAWKDDRAMAADLEKYVSQNLQRAENLDFMKRDYNIYRWSLPTLDRRLRYFELKYIDANAILDNVKEVVQRELDGPGKLLGYRAMNQTLRTEHSIKVPRHLVQCVLYDLNPEGVSQRRLENRKKPRNRPFRSKGSMLVVSVDGHDKLCGYQNSTVPLRVYGFLDTFSRKILSRKGMSSKSDPVIIGRLYFDLFNELETMPVYLRMDRGTETGKMASIHSYLMSGQNMVDNPIDSAVFGPSTTNKIERWWGDLHQRLEKFFTVQLQDLLGANEYDPANERDRQLLAYLYIPVVQRECDICVTMWNSH